MNLEDTRPAEPEPSYTDALTGEPYAGPSIRVKAGTHPLGDDEPGSAEPEPGDPLDALRCVVEKASAYGEDDDGFVNLYLLGTGAIHSAIRVLQEHGITARPAGHQSADLEPGA